jgi:hypothetical protein
MGQSELLAALGNGVARSRDMIARITDYHGGPVTTEYMLTSDIARELIEHNYEVEVECLNRKMVNGETMRRSCPPLPKFGSRRTYVAVLKDEIIPLGLPQTDRFKLGRARKRVYLTTANSVPFDWFAWRLSFPFIMMCS